MSIVKEIEDIIFDNELITKEQAEKLIDADLEELCFSADRIRKHFCDNSFDICTIINGKCGKCSENCKYCAQSKHYKTNIEEYPLLDTDEIVKHAKHNADSGVLRYSIVTSGRRLSDREIDKVCESIKAIVKNVDIEVCISFGLIGEEQFRKIKDAGAKRVHCNLETSRNFFPNVCTTHTYDEKIATLKAAQKVGLSVCSGGIMGLGETMEDRIDMAFTLRELGVLSVPINFLNPIKGTPFENNKLLNDDEKRRIVAIYRFILPKASIRLAGGRGLIKDKGESCFKSGANAAISGDMLTTSGITVKTDMQLINKLGYKAGLQNE